ncbi:hypothetical protein [Salisediminibacterium beveridgei]|uniref:Peptidase M n=1 Tax=Salisediminibacterium beveridgei TaxID=632773 RepID=A0A1D7QR47_9BACI|nr:hypothetical protein [Salisediminibacterium beveridgei]AOM81430.1 Peptidase M [Salisediminibacterium beveridgei]
MEQIRKRRKIITTLLASVLLLLIIPFVFLKGDNHSDAHDIEEIYHVYFEGERLGTVQNRDTVINYIENKQADGEKVFDHRLKDMLEFIPELVFDVRDSDEEVLAALKETLEIKVKSYQLAIDQETIGSVANEMPGK